MSSAKFLYILFLLSTFTFSAYSGGGLASDIIPYPFYSVQKITDGHDNKLMILNSGIASFKKRLDMIKMAQSSIEVEYFIYGLDQSSQIFTQELVAAAQRGVQVRILIDKSAAVFEFEDLYASALAEKGIEVKYYNSAPIYLISTVNFRNHRKLLSVDDKYAITGGRNIEDDYFDLSPEFNFIDRDVYVEGPIVVAMRESFDEFFKDSISETPNITKRPKQRVERWYMEPGTNEMIRKVMDNSQAIKYFEKKMAKAYAFLQESEELKLLRDKIEKIAGPILENNKLISCPEITFSTDAPGGTFWTRLLDDYSDEYRFLRKTLYDKASAVDKKLILSSPYMINNFKSRSLMLSLLDREVDIELYTNSLASTDALYVAANLYKDLKSWTGRGIKLYVHDGAYINETDVVDEQVKFAKWGTHSKTQIYYHTDYSEFMIGTYNIDNRSNHYNTEMAIFCKGSDELTKIVQQSIDQRIAASYQIHQRGGATKNDGKRVSVFGTSVKDLGLMLTIALPSWLLRPLL